MNTISGLPRLSREYNDGYRQAILDMIEEFDSLNGDLLMHHMRMNYVWCKKILLAVLENREKIRDDWNGFLRTEISNTGKRDVIKWFENRKEN